MRSYFITGTDTNVGKTYVVAGIVAALKKLSINVGIMKPFASGSSQKQGYKSHDVQIIANAAKIHDKEKLINPFFFPMEASPYSFIKKFNTVIDTNIVLECFDKLRILHDVMLVEGIGGIMTPILKNYFLINTIKDMNLDTIVVTDTKIGTINHTIMTCMLCRTYGINIRGLIINNLTIDGYDSNELKCSLRELINIPIIAIIPHNKLEIDQLSNYIIKSITLKRLFEL